LGVTPTRSSSTSCRSYQSRLDARDKAENGSDPEALTALVQALQAAGQGLGCLATPACCNNPACSSLVGATELQQVLGRGCICAGCSTARYCDRACQRAHWKRHKPVCKALAAAKQPSLGEVHGKIRQQYCLDWCPGLAAVALLFCVALLAGTGTADIGGALCVSLPAVRLLLTQHSVLEKVGKHSRSNFCKDLCCEHLWS
jgi:hypothetical protein